MLQDYLWVYVLGAVTIVSVIIFIATLSGSLRSIKKLKLKKSKLSLNISLLLISLSSLGLIIYLFLQLRDQFG